MQSISAAGLLNIWENGLDLTPNERALELLAAGDLAIPKEEIAKFPIGHRDGRLLTLREQIFGPDITALANCPKCNKFLETQLGVSDIRITQDPNLPKNFWVQVQNYRVSFRLPDSRDLIAIAEVSDPLDSKELLIRNCILQVWQDEVEKTNKQIPGEVLDAVIKKMDESDPQANIQLNLICPACGYTWQEQFDILRYFWSEIDNWATHTLEEVHILATAYGWRESDILSMSARRRQIYMEKVVE
jgi:hypothetical protein